jgi:hypothetical protein
VKTKIERLRGPRVNATDTPPARMAREMRRTFTDRDLDVGRYDTGIEWPKKVCAIGEGLSIAYTSDKWEKTDKWNDYKHVAEAPQRVLATPALTRTHVQACESGDRFPPADLDWHLPDAVAELTPLLFVEIRVYDRIDARGNGQFAADQDRGVKRIILPNSMLYGGYARKPGTAASSDRRRDYRPFLCIGSREHGCIMLITGDELDVTRDGLVG